MRHINNANWIHFNFILTLSVSIALFSRYVTILFQNVIRNKTRLSEDKDRKAEVGLQSQKSSVFHFLSFAHSGHIHDVVVHLRLHFSVTCPLKTLRVRVYKQPNSFKSVTNLT